MRLASRSENFSAWVLVALMNWCAKGMNINQVLPPAASTPGPGPHYVQEYSGNVSVLLGTTAFLNCRIEQLHNVTVSWLRVSEVPTLMSVGTYTYTMDNRIRIQHTGRTSDWTLILEQVRHEDAGVYDCQVGTTPPRSHLLLLTVVEPETVILGGSEVYIHLDSAINLTCILDNSPHPPANIYWQHNGQRIGYDSIRGGVNIVTTMGLRSISQLLVTGARASDSGEYTCQPEGAQPALARIHILNGKLPEAMQRGCSCPVRAAATLMLLGALTLLLMDR